MIVGKFLEVMGAVLVWVAGLFPDGTVPSWFTGFTSDLSTWLGTASTVGVWVPFNLGLTVMGALLVCITIGFAIRLFRIVASFLTLGGGAAG